MASNFPFGTQRLGGSGWKPHSPLLLLQPLEINNARNVDNYIK